MNTKEMNIIEAAIDLKKQYFMNTTYKNAELGQKLLQEIYELQTKLDRLKKGAE